MIKKQLLTAFFLLMIVMILARRGGSERVSLHQKPGNPTVQATPVETQWQESFPTFLTLLTEILHKGGVPTEEELFSRLHDFILLTDAYLVFIDTYAPKGTCQAEANAIFSGHTVDWEVTISEDAATFSYTKEMWLVVIHESISRDSSTLENPIIIVKFIVPKTKELPKKGDTLRIRGILETPKKTPSIVTGVGIVYGLNDHNSGCTGAFIGMPHALIQSVK